RQDYLQTQFWRGAPQIVLWLLPGLGINILFWGLVLTMAGPGAYEYITCRLGKKALDKNPIISPDIGSRGRATTPLTPKGYVRVSTELWKASSTDSNIDAGEEVVIVGIEGMSLFVAPLDKCNHEPSDQ
ncbi:MAG: NfeD family protein, partial [Dehalococcoidia bacterium]|nr:NfeD family protein [Dehalococcoidia bacterium]